MGEGGLCLVGRTCSSRQRKYTVCRIQTLSVVYATLCVLCIQRHMRWNRGGSKLKRGSSASEIPVHQDPVLVLGRQPFQGNHLRLRIRKGRSPASRAPRKPGSDTKDCLPSPKKLAKTPETKKSGSRLNIKYMPHSSNVEPNSRISSPLCKKPAVLRVIVLLTLAGVLDVIFLPVQTPRPVVANGGIAHLCVGQGAGLDA